jgi:biopolymer transport protein ExbD
MTKQQTIGVNLPVATTSQNDFKPDMINLGVSAVGDVFIDKNPVTLPDLQKQLQQRHALNPDTPVYISGDADTRHADMVRILDEVRRVGFTKVAFNVRPATP